MPRPWIKGVQITGQLTVFPTASLLSAPAWGGQLFTQTLNEFNRLAQANLFGVRLVRSNSPTDGTGGGANIQVDVSKGSHTFIDGQGVKQTGQLNVTPGQVRGITHSITFGAGASEKVAWAWVFVPANPVLGAGQRGVGNGVKVGLTLHELLHACGLRETDPGHKSTIQAGDVFMTDSIVNAGSRPDEDKYQFGSGNQPDAAGRFILSTTTVSLVQSVWLLGQF